MSQLHPPIVRFLHLIEEARPPERRPVHHRHPAEPRLSLLRGRQAGAGFGWWVFPPTDLRVLWDGHDVFWHHDSIDD